MTYSTLPLPSELDTDGQAASTGWKRSELGNVLKVIRGVTYKSAEARDSAAEGFLPVLRATNIGRELDFDAMVYVPENRVSQEQLLQVGDIVIAASSGSRSVVGKAALLKQGFAGSFGAFCFALRPNEQIDPRFLAYYLQTSEYRNRVSALSAGVNINNLRRSHIETLPFSYPDIDEQKKIVDEIETQFARLDDAVAALQRARTRLKRYRASVLKAACEGRLVCNERPSDWPTDTLGDHIERIEAGKNFRCDERPPGMEEVGIVKISAVTWGEFDEQESKTCKEISALRENLLIHPNDFLISRANTIELVGACVIARDVTLPVMLSDKVLRITFGPGIDQRWALHFLRSVQGRYEIESRATGNQLSMRNIGQQRIQAIPIPVPPLEAQHKIIEEIERRLSVIDQIEVTVEANLQRAETLRQSILRNALSGRVVASGQE